MLAATLAAAAADPLSRVLDAAPAGMCTPARVLGWPDAPETGSVPPSAIMSLLDPQRCMLLDAGAPWLLPWLQAWLRPEWAAAATHSPCTPASFNTALKVGKPTLPPLRPGARLPPSSVAAHAPCTPEAPGTALTVAVSLTPPPLRPGARLASASVAVHSDKAVHPKSSDRAGLQLCAEKPQALCTGGVFAPCAGTLRALCTGEVCALPAGTVLCALSPDAVRTPSSGTVCALPTGTVLCAL